MPSGQLVRILPWGLLPLLLGLQLLGTYAQRTLEEIKHNEELEIHYYLPATVEFAQYIFNLHSKDPYAYRLVRILKYWKEKDGSRLIIALELELSRTMCRKFEDDIQNCAFQPPPGSHTISCFFAIHPQPWETVFHLLNSTCVDS
ncbi:putative cystatin-9-like protein CST9LP1 [Dasypus novemcinctus]|uniref:putative cystatin-9-like protein CST9LP1 n=1 Tax=Dasypus novemcinctus TaxID=9361 RepID=UPI00265DD817|nr:putative cystatin-9-like protein CST9LP1 [Dasypus novemcinctus]